MASKPAPLTSDWDGHNRREAEPLGWHLKKEVNLSIIMTMITLTLAGFWGFADLKRDVELLKAGALVLHDRDTKQETEIKEALSQVREQYKELSNKLDRVIERSK
jgi:hypothetical protein